MKTWFTVMVALGVFSGCGKTNDAPSENENEVTERRSPSKAVRGRNARPVAAYWDGGVHMLGKPPSVLFAAWADGMVVRKVDQKTMAGFVSPEAISKLIATLRTAGVFASSTSASLEAHGMLFPDGPVRCLSIVDGVRWRTLYYHERYDLNRFDKMHPTASPSRRQCERFVADWRRVLAETAKISPDKLKPFSGDRPLTYPQYAKKPSPPEPAPGE